MSRADWRRKPLHSSAGEEGEVDEVRRHHILHEFSTCDWWK